MALVGPPILTIVLLQFRTAVWLPMDLMFFLTLVVATALVGGLLPSLVCALLASAALNFFFTQPTGGLTIADPQNATALVVFSVVAVAVASVVDLAERRLRQARQARAEATTLADLSRAVLAGRDSPQDLADELARCFHVDRAFVLERVTAGARGWRQVASHPVAATGAGDQPQWSPDDPAVEVGTTRLVLPGTVLTAADHRVLEVFGAQANLVLDRHRFRLEAERTRELEQVSAVRSALLTAASHDLRTPLASIRTSVDGLSLGREALDPEDRDSLVATIDTATGRLEGLIDNLLDLTRLQVGAVVPDLQSVSLEEIVPAALDGLDPRTVRLDLPEDLPLVRTDVGLLERVVANIAANAARHAPPGTPATVRGAVVGDRLELRVCDAGPGIAAADRERVFRPFERLVGAPGAVVGRPSEGLGLGLAVAKGLADALDVELRLEDTPGGGLTVVVAVPLASGPGSRVAP